MSDHTRPRAPDLTLPVLIGLAALLLSQAFQTVELVLERQALRANFDAQARDVAAALQVRGQLETLLAGATNLAGGGNAAAAAALADLARQGITYTPPPR